MRRLPYPPDLESLDRGPIRSPTTVLAVISTLRSYLSACSSAHGGSRRVGGYSPGTLAGLWDREPSKPWRTHHPNGVAELWRLGYITRASKPNDPVLAHRSASRDCPRRPAGRPQVSHIVAVRSKRCPWRDSNSHLSGFKAFASASWVHGHWWVGVESNHSPLSRARLYGPPAGTAGFTFPWSAPGIRTLTGPGLSRMPLPNWARAPWCLPSDSNRDLYGV